LLLKASDIKILLAHVKESDITGMVPTSSTSITLLLGDCLATTVMSKRKFSKEKFKIFHPGGNIGGSLLLAKDIMVTGKKLPLIDFKQSLGNALKIMNQKKLGIVVVLKNRCIEGLVTDGDLRREVRLISKKNNLEQFMTKYPSIVNENMSASKALAIMNEKKITSLLVVSDRDFKKKNKIRLKGIIHIHFLLKHGL
jgi:arabinose-5-phosphate isomerase